MTEVSGLRAGDSNLSALAKAADGHDKLLSEAIAKVQPSSSRYTITQTGANHGGFQIGHNQENFGSLTWGGK